MTPSNRVRQGWPGMFQSRLLTILIATLMLAFQVSPCSCGLICVHEHHCDDECNHGKNLPHRCSRVRCQTSGIGFQNAEWNSHPKGSHHHHHPCLQCQQADHMILRIVDLDISPAGLSRNYSLMDFSFSLIEVTRYTTKIERHPPPVKVGVSRMQV